ncbi:class I SAM-dependent methyltransferase [Brevibacillus sp. LEMMJ03]|uniref:class I SAM-dependent methyltransferase n=1 Tax=Brevibacillus sp. LEMMJ03 TaxID=2595056 RepID=UPI00117EA59D|nr:methyltransferase domain-containing protein [Brevibacillus sp. LEMMJ03]TRY26106.1 class I SAM-dependent methyltransferase [Brevibacillus sp. LEMMJ03]
MDQQAWIDWLQAETAVPFAGWDFSYVTRTGRMKEAPLPWNYANLVSRRLRGAESLLDMGTGGGELLSLLRPLPPRTFATEGYAPNVPVARARLEPLGVTVVEADGEADLPFADEVFELVINRHESYRPEEVCRIMKPGACFITQQVGGHNDLELNRMLEAPVPEEYLHWNLAYAAAQLEAAGLTVVERREVFSFTRFYDVGAIVYYLQAIPWQVPDFSVERCADGLLRIHRVIERDGYVDIPAHRFLLVAVK